MTTEMALMVEYGLAPMDAIVAATKTAAYNLGLAPEIGTLEVAAGWEGKLAQATVDVLALGLAHVLG